MKTQSPDTTEAFEQVYVARIRTFSPAKKFASVRSWTHSITLTNVATQTEKSDQERAMQFLKREYDESMAALFTAELAQHPNWVWDAPDIQAALLALLEVCEQQRIDYALTGSIACSVYGLPRSAQDVDLLASMRIEDFPAIANACQKAGLLLDHAKASEALAQHTCLHLLHLPSLIKIDILLPTNPYEEAVLQHRQLLPLIEGESPVSVLTPEDVALTRLAWYHHTGAQADDQWNDLLGLLKVQAPSLDLAYLTEQATYLHIEDLLVQSLVDAGIREI